MNEIKNAKSKLPNGKQPSVQKHLSSVAALAGKYSQEIWADKATRLAGQFHDFGKYGNLFQRVLTNSEQGIVCLT